MQREITSAMKLTMMAISALIAVFVSQLSHGGCLKNVAKESPTSRFTLEGNTVRDQHTGLQWQRCPLGQSWASEKNRCNLHPEENRLYTWAEALQAATEHRLNDLEDWRLPNKNELASIVELACSGPAINAEVFPGTPVAEFWTSTPGRREAGYAWRINFKTGDLINIDTNNRYSVRLVRD